MVCHLCTACSSLPLLTVLPTGLPVTGAAVVLHFKYRNYVSTFTHYKVHLHFLLSLLSTDDLDKVDCTTGWVRLSAV